MSDWGPPSGFALRRNGSCLSEEKACGPTFDEFNRCCPKSAECSKDLGICCKPAGNCIQMITNPPHCANKAWNLFNNSRDGGYFCCLQGMNGFYYNHQEGVGCMGSNADAPADTQWMSMISSGKIQIPLADCSV